MGKIEIAYLDDWDPEVEPEYCPECASEDLAIESSGPLTGWIECQQCMVWIPQI